MLNRKYGKYLSNLWQIFENRNSFGNIDFLLQNGNCLAI